MIKFRLIKSKIIFFTIPIALISLEIYFGIILGYILSKIFCGKNTGQVGIIKSIVFNIGKWRFHLHHWLIGFSILISVLLLKFSLPLAPFSFGFLGGLVFQGIFDYSDWHKILIKKNKMTQQKI